MRMLMNNLDPDVAERPQDLVVYGGTGRAARNWECYHAIVNSLRSLDNDETLLVQSGKPVGIFRTHDYAPRVLICNSNLVGHWSNWEKFNELEKLGLIMYGQMTAGSWIYIGSQGIIQGTYETFSAAGREASRRRARRQADRLRRHGRHERRAAAGGDHDRRVLPRHRGRSRAHQEAPAHRLLRLHGQLARRGAAHPEERGAQEGEHLRRAGRQLRRHHS